MKDYKVLLEKFWNGSASATEKLRLYKIMIEKEDAIRSAMQDDFEQGKAEDLSPGASQAILESLHREIGQRAARSIEMPQPKFPAIFRWAAALLVVGFAAFFSWHIYTGQGAGTQNEIAAATETMIDNQGTAVKEIVMSDGSGIKLYPNSSIRFTQPFNTQAIRSIQLKGKADFKVKHDADKPFEVIAYNIKTTDIGTEFCINAPDEHSFRLALREGSVKIAAMPNSGLYIPDMILKPGEEAHWDDSGKKMVLGKMVKQTDIQQPAPDNTPAVKERLVFDKTPLHTVFDSLESREGIAITFKKEDLKDLTFTGSIEPTDKIETALNIICNLNGLNYRKTKQAFIVAKNK